MKLSLDNIPVDQEGMQQVLQHCREKKVETGIILSKHTGAMLFELLLMECKGFVFMLLISMTMLGLLSSWFRETYDLLVLFQAGITLLFALVYLLKDMHTKQQEIFFPTRIGGTRVFLYKTAILTIASILCTMFFVGNGVINYEYSIYRLLFVSLIPQLLLHGLTMQIAGRFLSLRSAISVLLVLYCGYITLYLILQTTPQFLQLLPYAGILVLACMVYDGVAIHFFHRRVHQEGGYLLWN